MRAHKQREWFQSNKERYEESVRGPFLKLIADFAPALKTISPHFVAGPSPTGGSMMRIYRATRLCAGTVAVNRALSAARVLGELLS